MLIDLIIWCWWVCGDVNWFDYVVLFDLIMWWCLIWLCGGVWYEHVVVLLDLHLWCYLVIMSWNRSWSRRLRSHRLPQFSGSLWSEVERLVTDEADADRQGALLHRTEGQLVVRMRWVQRPRGAVVRRAVRCTDRPMDVHAGIDHQKIVGWWGRDAN